MLFGFIKDILRGDVSVPVRSETEQPQSANSSGNENLVTRRVLNVGGNSKDIPIPVQYQGWQHVLLDIDARGNPDVVCDARALFDLPASQYDAVYCSHNLEHFYRHDVPKVLAGFHHVLKDNGFAHILVPDMSELMKIVVDRGLDIDDFLYTSPAGPIHVIDVIYGLRVEIERSGNDFFAHKTGFTQKSLLSHLRTAGFCSISSAVGNLEVGVIAFKNHPTTYAIELFQLPQEITQNFPAQ